MKRTAILGAFIFCVASLPAQSISPSFKSVFLGTDGLVHVITHTGRDIAVEKRRGQVKVSSPLLSMDKRFAGWMVFEKNCCTSYPIATSVAIYSGKRTLYLHDEKMVVDWCFVPGRPQVAVATETTHGWAEHTGPDLRLYSARSGGVLQRWNGPADAAIPAWARCLKSSRPELFR